VGSIEPDHDNVRAAMRHFLATGEAECAARLGGALGMFWFFRGHFDEGRAWLREVRGNVCADGLFGSAERPRRLLQADPTRWSIRHHASDDLVRDVDPPGCLTHDLVCFE
jgi:hypothetical protein